MNTLSDEKKSSGLVLNNSNLEQIVSCPYLMYKCINELAPVRLINEIVMTADIHWYPTRAAQHGNVHVPKPNIE